MGPETAPQPPRCASLKSSPRKVPPVCTLGRMRGAIWYLTFPCRTEGAAACRPNGIFLLPPLGKSIAPSSVTQTASPKGSLWVNAALHEKRPKSGHVDGHCTSPTRTMYQPPKRASGNERAIKGAGHPRDFFASGLSPRKPGSSLRDRAGTHLAGANLRGSKPDHLPTAAETARRLFRAWPLTPPSGQRRNILRLRRLHPWVKPSSPRLAI